MNDSREVLREMKLVLTDERNISESGDWCAFLRWVGVDVDADDEHASTLSNRCPEKRPSPSERIGGEEEENGTSADLDDTVDTGGEETGGGTGDTQVLEDLRSIL